MIFEKLLMPDLLTEHYYDITPETVKSYGARAILCDIDNTLATYNDPEPPTDVLRWIQTMKNAGIQVAFVSNNEAPRVNFFNRDLGLVAYSKAGKPKTGCMEAALRDMGVSKSEAVALGDQLLTDCAAAKRMGIPSLIVPPIKDKKTLFFRFKRLLEKPYIKKYKKVHSDVGKAL